jgi:hypothetical protein
MKRSLFLYLFILSALTALFTYVYFDRKIDVDQKHCDATAKKLRDSLDLMSNQVAEASYFSLAYDTKAQDYFTAGEKPVDYLELIPNVTNALMAANDNPAGNPYTGQPQLGERKFIINKAKVLNHRWIIADFTDNTYWGEVLIKYFVNDDGTFSFEVMQSLLHQN